MRAWVVAAGLIQGPDGFVLVQNRRRDGSLDWSQHLAGAHRWVREPIEAWIVGPATTSFRYRVEGPSGASVVVRTFPAEP